MTREELIAYDKWLTRRKWGTGEIISPERAADIYLAEHSLPPAEGAEAIVKKYEDEYDFKFHWVQRDRVIRMMREFAAQPQPKLDPKKVQWSGYGELGNISQKPQPTAEGAEEILERAFNNGAIRRITYIPDIRGIISAMNDFATLHAQRIADKMKEANQFILDIAGVLGIETDGVGFDGLTLSIDDFKEAAEKMVSERLRNELMRYDQWLLANDMGQMFDDTMKCVDEYLNTREK